MKTSCRPPRPSCPKFLASRWLLALTLAASVVQAAPPACSDPLLILTPDYQFVIGSAGFSDADADPESGSQYRWLTNGAAYRSGDTADLLLLHGDGDALGANGEAPATATDLAFVPGRWGQALEPQATTRLRFATAHNLNVAEGTIELWVALVAPGTDPVYTNRDHVLFHYRTPAGEDLRVAQSRTSGVLYGGGTVRGQWQSAYGGRASMRAWTAGEWHHLAFTFSAAANLMRFFVDGVQTAANNEGHYWAPATNGPTFSLAGDLWGNTAAYRFDAVRITGRALEPEEVAARAARTAPPRANEVWWPTADLPLGLPVVFEFTPRTPTETGLPCASAPRTFFGVPLLNARPPGTLLPPGGTALDFAIDTTVATACAWSLGQPLPFDQMTPFATGTGSTHHETRLTGLNPDPQTVNTVYVRCASDPDYVLALPFRSLGQVCPPFPRTGNLWGWSQVAPHGTNFTAKIDLWLGLNLSSNEIRTLRAQNPHALMLTSINAVENTGLPADFYLKDIHGQRIEVWPGSFRLNLTRTNVAEYQARFAHQSVLDAGLMADGVFFDNVMTSQSWQNHDIFGNPVAIDADEDGVADDPATFDARWKAGVFHELRTFRQLMPHALASGHSMEFHELDTGRIFNGKSFGFVTADVLEGESTFAQVFQQWADWHTTAPAPHISMIESSPIDQIAYGYDYDPLAKIPPATLDFARSYYPWMRFGLALTLMHDGYFAHEFGDTHHGNDWWYDELDFDLGYPLGPARRLDFTTATDTNLLVNADFESPIVDPWRLSLSSGAAATLARDTAANAPSGTTAARINITAITGTDWHVTFGQWNRSIQAGVVYDLVFHARAAAPRTVTLSAQKGAPDWRGYGLGTRVELDTAWREFTVPWSATESAADARIQFFLGSSTGTVWLDHVRVLPHPPDVYRRDFTRGVVLLNGTDTPRTIPLETGLSRIAGAQAPATQGLLDDAGPAFTLSGAWTNRTVDSGEWKAAGPFYHAWNRTLHQSLHPDATATWQLPIEFDGVHSVAAWWPAAPDQSTFSSSARYDVLSNGVVVASAQLDQTRAGDEWHPIAQNYFAANATNTVRLTATAGTAVADALHLWSEARFNDGSPAPRVRLQPFDGILLRRDQPTASAPRIDRVERSGTNLTFHLSALTPGTPHELETTPELQSPTWTTALAFQPDLPDVVAATRAAPGTAFYRVKAGLQ